MLDPFVLILTITAFIPGIILALPVIYILMLTILAWFGSGETRITEELDQRFIIIIPAHNEEKLLPVLLDNLKKLEYPKSLFKVHVIADNCTDQTAEIAKQGGAIVSTRTNPDQRGKGYALQWLLQKLWATNEPHDAVIILDADSVISTNFLQVMNTKIKQGDKVIQAYYSVLKPERSWSESLRYAALAVLHYIRPLGRMTFNASAGLKGNGMVFAADILKRYQWTASVTEDIEYHMALLLDGERVAFAPDAVVLGEMPENLEKSQSQHERWESGRLQMARQYIPKLMGQARAQVKKRNYRNALRLIDAAMEHIIPPFAILFGVNLFLIGANLVFYIGLSILNGRGYVTYQVSNLAWSNFLLSLGILIGQTIYLFSGLYLTKTPARIYLRLFYTPVYLVWKIWQYVGVIRGRGQKDWIRTLRNEG